MRNMLIALALALVLAGPGAAAAGPAPPAAAANRLTLDAVIGWIEASDRIARRLATLERLNAVDVARIGDGAGRAVTARIDAAVADNEARVARLRDTIRGFPALAGRLEAVGLEVADVVAVRLSRRGDILLVLRG